MTTRKTHINHRKLVRAQLTPDQYNKLLALVTQDPYGQTMGIYAAQLLSQLITEASTL